MYNVYMIYCTCTHPRHFAARNIFESFCIIIIFKYGLRTFSSNFLDKSNSLDSTFMFPKAITLE